MTKWQPQRQCPVIVHDFPLLNTHFTLQHPCRNNCNIKQLIFGKNCQPTLVKSQDKRRQLTGEPFESSYPFWKPLVLPPPPAASAIVVARGVNKPVVTIAQHACSTCETSIKTVGVGKQASQVAMHNCTMAAPGAPNCCK